MRFNIISLFPEFFDSPLSSGLMERARAKGMLEFNFVNPRDFATDNHRSVDDRPYGGGPGMVMTLDPLVRGLRSLPSLGRIILLSPAGPPFDQEKAAEISREEEITLICGRYEGIDARLKELFPLEELSVGDYVLNGGETAALGVIEASARLLPDFMGHADSAEEESFSGGLLEYPHYTRPEEYEGLSVPPVLLSGDHAAIAEWRGRASLEHTLESRPGLLSQARLDHKDAAHLRSLPRRKLGRNFFLALVHHPVRDRRGKTLTVSLTNLDIHDIARCSRCMGLGGFFIATPLEDQQRLARKLIAHWTSGPGAESNPDRAEALSLVRVKSRIEDAADAVEEICGRKPLLVGTSAGFSKKRPVIDPGRVRAMLDEGPVLLLLGTGFGLAREALDLCQGVLRPIRFMDRYNHFPVRSAAAIMLDRIFGDVY